MITKRQLGIYESFEYDSVANLQKHVRDCLDAISDATAYIATQGRDELDTLLIQVGHEAFGRIGIGYYPPNGRTTASAMTLQLIWATYRGQKRVILCIKRTDVCPDAHPSPKDKYSFLSDVTPWIRTGEPKQKTLCFATVFPQEYMAQRDDLPMAALKRLPALPSEIDIERIHGFWCSQVGSDELLLLLAPNYTYILGTPVGWVKLKNTSVFAIAEKSKDPWRVLAALGVKIPRLKKNWIWNEAMAAELMMILLAGETQR